MAAGDGIRETVSTDVLGAVAAGGAPAVRPKHPFEQVFHRNAAAMLIATPLDLRILDVNQRFLELTDHRREDVIGKTVVDIGLVSRELAHARIVTSAQQVVTRVRRSNETDIATRTGERKTIISSVDIIDLEGHGPCILSTIIDITERKRAERRLAVQHAVTSALVEARDVETVAPRVAEIMCRGDEWDFGAIWLAESDGYLRCRGSWQHPDLVHAEELMQSTRQLAFSAGDTSIIGRVASSRVLEAVTIDRASFPRAPAALACGLAQAVSFPMLHGDHVLGVVDLMARRSRAIDDSAHDLFGALGRGLGLFIGRLQAETALRASEDRLRLLNAELERRVSERTAELEITNRDLEAFSFSISHDLRAPLRAVNGFAGILVEDLGPQLSSENARLLARIRDSGKKLGSMIDDLLAFARLGRSTVKRRAFDLDVLVREVLLEVARDRDIDPSVVAVQPLGVCNGDPALLRQVWVNLIDNAIKYSHGRSPIEIVIGVDPGTGTYFVRDNGVGFDPAYTGRLFGVFQRLHHASEFEGTGVGLAIVRRIVERHGGVVSAASTIGEGSTFRFSLGALARSA